MNSRCCLKSPARRRDRITAGVVVAAAAAAIPALGPVDRAVDGGFLDDEALGVEEKEELVQQGEQKRLCVVPCGGGGRVWGGGGEEEAAEAAGRPAKQAVGSVAGAACPHPEQKRSSYTVITSKTSSSTSNRSNISTPGIKRNSHVRSKQWKQQKEKQRQQQQFKSVIYEISQ